MTKVFSLSEAAYQKGSDYDIVMLYQVLLGRNPENSQVIQDHRSNTFNVALQTFVSSPEFREGVLDPISRGAPVRRHDIVPRPSPEQLNWLFGRTVLDESQKNALRQAASWEQFFAYLCSLDGFLEPLPAPPARPAPAPAPFRPISRPAPRPVPAALPAQVPGRPVSAGVAATGPGNAEIMAKLDRLESMLAALMQQVGAPAQPAPDQSAAAAGLPQADPTEAPKVRASSKRQAR